MSVFRLYQLQKQIWQSSTLCRNGTSQNPPQFLLFSASKQKFQAQSKAFHTVSEIIVIRAYWACIIEILQRLFLVAGKAANKEGAPEEKKDDGELWCNVEAQAAFLGPNLWDKTLPYDADLKVRIH
jgi:hypothetical protein